MARPRSTYEFPPEPFATVDFIRLNEYRGGPLTDKAATLRLKALGYEQVPQPNRPCLWVKKVKEAIGA